MIHPHRDCVYEEAKACIQRKKDKSITIEAQINKYRFLNYPERNGMVATGIIVRRKNEEIDKFCELWWREVREHSKRDQLSFNFINWITPINYHQFPFEVLTKEFLLHKHGR